MYHSVRLGPIPFLFDINKLPHFHSEEINTVPFPLQHNLLHELSSSEINSLGDQISEEYLFQNHLTNCLSLNNFKTQSIITSIQFWMKIYPDNFFCSGILYTNSGSNISQKFLFSFILCYSFKRSYL